MNGRADSVERPKWDEYFLIQAEIAKLRSNCITRRVGASIAKENRQIATGYNGTPPGMLNCYEGGCERCSQRIKGKIKAGENLERCLCMHAESNAILQCALFGNSTKNATIYSTFTPCIECSKMIISVEIKKVVLIENALYPEDGITLLKESKIELKFISREDIEKWKRLIFTK